MSNPKGDCERLLSSVLPFARLMLDTHGEFHPYGGAMLPNGELVNIAGFDGRERPPAEETINFLKSAFAAAGKQGQYIATALVYDVRVTLPASGEKSDAIAVALDHRDAYSVIVLFPYKMENGKAVIGSAFANRGEAKIFPAN